MVPLLAPILHPIGMSVNWLQLNASGSRLAFAEPGPVRHHPQGRVVYRSALPEKYTM
jgi:hypothetical protein